MPFTYRQVKDLYDVLKDSGAVQKSLPEWSTEMGNLTGSDLYAEGQHDNWLKRASVGVDRAIESVPGLVEGARDLGGDFGSMFGQRETGAQIGEGLPRMAANFLPMLIPGAGWGAAAARLGGMGLAQGAQTYTETGSPAAGVLSGVTAAALPKIAELGEQGVLRAMGGREVAGSLAKGFDEAGFPTAIEAVKKLFPTTIAQKVGNFVGGQGAAAIAMEGSGLAQDVLAGRPMHNPFSAETALNLTLGQLPFAALHLAGKAFGVGKGEANQADLLQAAINHTESRMKVKEATDALNAKTDIEKVPEVVRNPIVDPAVLAETNSLKEQIGALRAKQDEITSKENITPDDIEELKRATEADNALSSTGVDDITDPFQPSTSDKFEVTGKEITRGGEGTQKYRTIAGADGQVIRYSRGLYETPPRKNSDGTTTYFVPKSELYHTVLESRKTEIADPALPEVQPFDPVKQYMDRIAALDKVEMQVEAAKTPADYQKAVVAINSVRDYAGLNPVTAAQFERLETKLTQLGSKNPRKDAIKAQTAKAKRQVEAISAEEQAALQHKKEQADFYGHERTGLENQQRAAVAKGQDVEAGASTSGTKRTSNGLQPVLSIPKWDGATEPIHNFLDEVMSGTLAAKRDAQDSFAQWQKTSGDKDTPLGIEGERFKRLWIMEAEGKLEGKATLSENEAKLFNDELNADGIGVEDYRTLMDFPERDHVLNWLDAVNEKVNSIKAKNQKPVDPEPFAPREVEGQGQLPAGGGFVWGLARYNPETNRLGDKHTLPKSGIVTEAQLKAIGGRGKPLQDVEIEMMKAVAGDAFDGKGNVDVRKLDEGLKKNPVQVEVKKLGNVQSKNTRKQEAIHLLETAGYTIRPDGRLNRGRLLVDADTLPPNLQGAYAELALSEASLSAQDGEARYSFLGPKSESDMPGYVEGLVRVPSDAVARPNDPNATVKEAHGDLYSGPHFGSEDNNVLAFFRGYEETLPDGTKAFHVIEVQSDWAQRNREGKKEGFHYPLDAPNHPLLPVYKTLALKAAIGHAKSIGATKIILPDAETAMMTEGHDKAAKGVFNPTEKNVALAKQLQEAGKGSYQIDKLAKGEQVGDLAKDELTKLGFDFENEVSQAGGMRLHYDTTLPSAMRKLTGDKGQGVELGFHKNTGLEDGPDGTITSRGSPIFKNPDGTPKSSISGTVYDLSKIQSTSEAQGGLTLGDPSRAPREPQPFVPQTEAQMAEAQSLSGDGHGLLAPLLESENPVTKAIASEWVAKFPQLLANIQSRVADSAGSYTQAGELGVSRITFDSSVVGMSKNAQELLKLHEVAHGLTLHLLNSLPPEHPLMRQLESIRQRAIEALPKNLRKMYEEALASNWMERNRADDSATVWKELADTTDNRNILYALMDNKELTAQAYNSPAFRKYMQGVPGKTGLWKSFVKWSKELLGIGEKVHDNAFGELIETTHQLMEQGEYLATVREFGERYFEAQGKGGTYGQQQTQRALNLIAESLQGISRDELHQSLRMGEDRFNVALTKAKANLEGKLAERGEDFESVSGLMDELGHDPSVRGVDDFVESNLADGKDVTHAMDLMPQAASKYIFQKLADHKDVLEMIRAATDQKNEAMVNIANPEFLRGPVAGALKAIDQMLGQEARQTAFAQQLVGLNSVDPQGFLEASAAAPKAVEDFMEGGKAVVGKAGSWMANFLEPLGQLARRIPEAAEAISKGFQLTANARKMFSDVIKPMGIDQFSEYLDPNPTKESVTESVKVFQSENLTRKVDKWMFLNNKEGKEAVTMLPASHPEIAKLLYGLSDADKKAVTDVVMKAGKVTQVLNAKKLEKMREIAAVNGAGVVMTDMGGKTKDAIALSDTLLGAVLKMKDPMTAWQGQAEIANVEKRMEAEPFLNLLRFAQGEAEKIGLWKEYFDKNPFWATAQRTERYLIKAFRNGKPVTYQASSTAEAKEITAKYKLSLREPFVDQWKGKEDEPFAVPNMGAETVARMQQLEENQIAMLKKAGVLVTEEDVNAFRRSSVASQVIRESTQSLSGVKEPPRLLGQGADEIPWMWNHITHAQRESTYWSRQLLRAQARTYLRDSELASNEGLRKQLATHFENLLSPDPIAAQKMTKFAATWFMGFNLASVLINAAQPFTTHVAELTAITGKPIDSYRRTLDALKETAGSAFTKKEWSTPEVERFMKDAAADGERGLSMFDDDAAAQESIVTNYKRAMTKHKTQSLGQRLETASGAYSTAAMWVFKHGEQLNSTAALLASFKLYREQGLGFEEAKAKAYEFNHAVNFSGGRAQRPVGAFSGQGAFPRTVAMLGTSLQSYVLGTTFQIARYLQRGGFRPEGLKPHEVFAARKAAIQMLGTQFAAAGLLGMPFVSGAIALLDKLFPDLELNRNIREGMEKFLSSDGDNGSTLTDIAMTGVPSMLGWDMQSRLSMGNTLPGVSEVNGFQAENLMGPVGNIVKNFVGGVQGWSQGDLAGGTQKFLPPVVKKLTEVGSSFLNDGGEIRDYQGRPLEKPSAGEQLGRLIGFQPKRLSDQNAAARIATQASEVQNRRTAEENSDLAKEVLKGNFGNVRSQLIEKSRSDNSYNPADAVKSISRAAEELKFPRDLRREGNLGTVTARTNLLNSYSNLTPVGGSEVERLQFRVGVEQRLGFPPQNLRGDLAMAQMMDQLKAAKPGATRVELRAAAQLALRRASTSRQMLPSQDE